MNPPPLEEQARWPLTDDPEVVTETDIDWVAEIREADECAENDLAAERWFMEWGCLGRDWRCGHYGWQLPRPYMEEV
jgi:hypothetical protein